MSGNRPGLISGGSTHAPLPSYAPPPYRPPAGNTRPRRTEEDVEMRLAIAASKAQAEEEDRKRQQQRLQHHSDSGEDEDLALAIKLSLEEEDRRKQVEAALLFDDFPTVSQAEEQPPIQVTAWDQQPQNSSFDSIHMPFQTPQATGWNHGYQQQANVDWLGNSIDQRQPLANGFFNQQYQPTGFGNAMQTNSNSSQLAQQHTPFKTQQPQQQRQQEQLTVPLIDLLDQSPAPEKQAPQTELPTPMFNQPFAQHPQPPLVPAKSGSNNPFLLPQLTSGPKS